VSAALRCSLRRERLSTAVRPKPRRCRWPASCAASLADEGLRACHYAPVIANTARMASQLIVALDHRSLRVLGMGDGARNVDCPRVSEKAPAGDFKRGFTSPTLPAISARRQAALLSRRPHRVPDVGSTLRYLFPSSENCASNPVRMRFMRTQMALRCVGERPLNSRAPLKTVHSASGALHDRPASIGPQFATVAPCRLFPKATVSRRKPPRRWRIADTTADPESSKSENDDLQHLCEMTLRSA